MNTTSARSDLSRIVLDPTPHQITDDLFALDARLSQADTDVGALADWRANLPDLLPIRGRAQANADEVRRLIKGLAREPELADDWIDVANALTVLVNASNLSLLLLPPRSIDDAWASRNFGFHLLQHTQRHGDGEELALARRATSAVVPEPGDQALPTDTAGIRDMIETMARRASALQPKPLTATPYGTPAVHPLEHAESLKAFFAPPQDLMRLFDGANKLLHASEGFSASGLPARVIEDATDGAIILSYARLLRVALWPARNERDVEAKIAARDLVRARAADPERLGALFEIALGQGEMVAGQSSRFLNIDAVG
ncbi:hypothetical protein ABIE41_003790 [Bosea sp. OAE506]|uniref:hypothetical protein n=1 Tax=Bosea sp. OAE506 TaxID=2663870 RepID=UPI00178A0577